MWLRSIFLKTLTGCWPLLRQWSMVLGAAVLLVVVTFAQVRALVTPPNWLAALANFFEALAGLPVASGEWVRALTWQFVLPLLLAAYAVDAGSRLVGGDEALAEMELLLAYPVTRRRLLLEKVGVLVITTAALALFTWALAALGFLVAVPHDPAPGLNVAAGLFLQAMVFGCFALAMAAQSNRRRALALGLGVLTGAALLALAGVSLPPALRFLLVLSPLYDYTAGQVSGGLVALLAVLCIALLGAALAFFEGREVG